MENGTVKLLPLREWHFCIDPGAAPAAAQILLRLQLRAERGIRFGLVAFDRRDEAHQTALSSEG